MVKYETEQKKRSTKETITHKKKLFTTNTFARFNEMPSSLKLKIDLTLSTQYRPIQCTLSGMAFKAHTLDLLGMLLSNEICGLCINFNGYAEAATSALQRNMCNMESHYDIDNGKGG